MKVREILFPINTNLAIKIEDTHVKGNLEGVKNKAIEDLKKAHTETVAKINGDDTLDKATKNLLRLKMLML